jgi:hypothetical protein
MSRGVQPLLVAAGELVAEQVNRLQQQHSRLQSSKKGRQV